MVWFTCKAKLASKNPPSSPFANWPCFVDRKFRLDQVLMFDANDQHEGLRVHLIGGEAFWLEIDEAKKFVAAMAVFGC